MEEDFFGVAEEFLDLLKLNSGIAYCVWCLFALFAEEISPWRCLQRKAQVLFFTCRETCGSERDIYYADIKRTCFD